MNFTRIKEILFKFWLDKFEVSILWYKARALYNRVFDKFDNGYFYIADPKKYRLSMNENFTKSRLDTDRWHIGQVWGIIHPMFPFQYTDKSCIEVNGDNNLVMINKYAPKKITHSGIKYNPLYAHGEITAKERFRKGVFEIRCKIPKNYNNTSAFWISAADSREIDIFEFFPKGDSKNSRKQYITVHWDREGDLTYPLDRDMSSKSIKLPKNVTNMFHTYTLIWTDDKLEFKFDGVTIRKLTNKKLLSTYDLKMKLILGSQLTVEPNLFSTDSMTFTATVDIPYPEIEPSPFIIDYVKVWQQL